MSAVLEERFTGLPCVFHCVLTLGVNGVGLFIFFKPNAWWNPGIRPDHPGLQHLWC